MRSLAAYRRVFANPALARLLIGEFVSSIGDWLYLVALLVVVYQPGGSALLLGIIGAARVVPYIVLSVPAGIIADRYDRRAILIVTDLGRGVIMLVLALLVATHGPILWIVVLSFLAACLSAFFGPAIGALLPSLARDETELGPANAAWSSLDNLAFVIGPALAGVLIALGGLPLAFLLNAVSFGIIAAVLWRIPRPTPAASPVAAAPSAAAETPAAVRDLARPMAGVALIDITDGFVSGGLAMLTVVIALDVLHAGDAATGWLNAAIGLGGLIGALLSGPVTLRQRLEVPLLAGGLTLGVGVVLLGQAGALVPALGAMVIAYAGLLLLEVITTTLFQRAVPDAIRGRALGALHTLIVAAYALGAFVTPLLATAIGTVLLLALLGGTMAVATVIGVFLLGRAARAEAHIDPAARRFVELPLFDGLAPIALELTARRLVRQPVRAGDVIVRQGEPADRFHFIVEGTFSVSEIAEGGPHTLRLLGPDEVFGEIGLLRRVPRTATVTAETDGTLLSLGGEEFVELVSSAAGVGARLLDLHRGSVAGPRGANLPGPLEETA